MDSDDTAKRSIELQRLYDAADTRRAYVARVAEVCGLCAARPSLALPARPCLLSSRRSAGSGACSTATSTRSSPKRRSFESGPSRRPGRSWRACAPGTPTGNRDLARTTDLQPVEVDRLLKNALPVRPGLGAKLELFTGAPARYWEHLWRLHDDYRAEVAQTVVMLIEGAQRGRKGAPPDRARCSRSSTRGAPFRSRRLHGFRRSVARSPRSRPQPARPARCRGGPGAPPPPSRRAPARPGGARRPASTAEAARQASERRAGAGRDAGARAGVHAHGLPGPAWRRSSRRRRRMGRGRALALRGHPARHGQQAARVGRSFAMGDDPMDRTKLEAARASAAARLFGGEARRDVLCWLARLGVPARSR